MIDPRPMARTPSTPLGVGLPESSEKFPPPPGIEPASDQDESDSYQLDALIWDHCLRFLEVVGAAGTQAPGVGVRHLAGGHVWASIDHAHSRLMHPQS